MQIIPSLMSVEDEYGNDLVYLGLVTSTGFQTPYSTFTRQKGKSTAVNITGLFDWSGQVCYFNSVYCTTPDQCTTTSLCCTVDAFGMYQNCTPKTDLTSAPAARSIRPPIAGPIRMNGSSISAIS